MTEEAIEEVIITSTPAPAAPKSEDQLMNSPDATIDDSSVPPDIKRKEKPVPHYLRASTRSCHDNCKYGTHQSPESKKPWHVRRAQLRYASTGNHEIDRVEIVLPKRARPSKDQKLKISHVKDGNATALAKPEPTSSKAPQEIVPGHPERFPCIGDLPAEASEPGNLPTDAECFVISHDDVADFGDGRSSDGAESIELEMPIAIQDSDTSVENMEDDILASENVCKDEAKSPVDPVSDRSANNRASSEVRNTLIMMAPAKHEQAELGTKSKSSADERIKPKEKPALSVTRNNASTQKSGRTSHPKAVVADPEISSEPKPMRARTNASAATTTKFSRQKKINPTVTSAVPKVKGIKVPLPSNATGSSAKPARLAKLKVSTAENATSPSLSSEKQTDRKMTVRNVAQNVQVLQKQREEKVTPRSLKLSRSINMPAKPLSSVKVRTVKKEKIAPPIRSSKKVSGTENFAADAKDAKEKGLKPASLLKVQKPGVYSKESQPRKEKTDAPTPRTTAKVSKRASIPFSTATQPPRKLTFRRGKVLNPDDSGSSTPARRLRFRPAVAATVRSRGGRVTGKGTGRSAAGARDAGTSLAEVVVLRRRRGGVNGDRKRQEPVLLNNVIEETASRLVIEARKSKVKALVGAFETVISLQEGGKAGPLAAATTTTVAQ